jgi:NitT/TauT family transport system substrate-binding protein
MQLKFAVLPIIDALPLYVAQEKGYFAENNLEVMFLPVAAAAERDQMIAAGQADAMINDLVSVALYNKQQATVQTVRFARTADANTAMYRVLAAKNSGITSPDQLAGVPIGMSQNTIIDYVTSRLLEKEGLNPAEIQSVAVPKLADRLALLGKGELKAVTLPEPFGTVAQGGGAVLIVDDSTHPEYGNSVLSFRKAYVDANPDAVRAFLAAVDKASADVNRAPEDFRALLGTYKMVPDALQSSYPIPPFPTGKAGALPTDEQWQDVTAWLQGRGLMEQDLPYADSITGAYLP